MTLGVVLQFPAVDNSADRLPNRLRHWRLARGMTLKQVAQAGVGVTFSHIAKIETGERELTKPVMERFAALFGVAEADLLNPADGGLSPDERHLVDAYRAMPPPLRAAIDALAASVEPGEVVNLPERKAG